MGCIKITLFVVLSPILILYMWFRDWRRNRRLHKLVAQSECEACGQLLGSEAVKIAERSLQQAYDEAHAEIAESGEVTLGPTIIGPAAICPGCGEAYSYDDDAGRLE